MHPTLLKIGSFELASYGLMIALGYAAACLYLQPRLKKINLDKDTFWNLIFIAFAGALVGSKLLFVLLNWDQLGPTTAQKLATIVRDFRYGFVFFGGMIVSVCGVVIYIKKKKLPFLKVADFMLVGLPLGHALGRIGCFFAGCCYGRPTSMPWGVRFTDPHSLVPPDLLGVPLHPTQLYESAANLLLFFVLARLYNKPHKDGVILLLYVACYSLLRFTIEFFRGDYRGGFVLGLSPSQCIAILISLFTFGAWFFFTRKGTSHGNKKNGSI